MDSDFAADDRSRPMGIGALLLLMAINAAIVAIMWWFLF